MFIQSIPKRFVRFRRNKRRCVKLRHELRSIAKGEEDVSTVPKKKKKNVFLKVPLKPPFPPFPPAEKIESIVDDDSAWRSLQCCHSISEISQQDSTGTARVSQRINKSAHVRRREVRWEICGGLSRESNTTEVAKSIGSLWDCNLLTAIHEHYTAVEKSRGTVIPNGYVVNYTGFRVYRGNRLQTLSAAHYSVTRIQLRDVDSYFVETIWTCASSNAIAYTSRARYNTRFTRSFISRSRRLKRQEITTTTATRTI